MKTKYYISRYTPLERKDKGIQEVKGEVMTISKVKVGIRKVDLDDEVIISCIDAFWQVTEMETGSLIVKYAKTRKYAIKEATEKINGISWDKAISDMKKELKKSGIKLPVNK
jgi:hypothetical protein